MLEGLDARWAGRPAPPVATPASTVTATPPPATPRPAAAPPLPQGNGEFPTPAAPPATPERVVAVAPAPRPDGRLPAFVWYIDVWILLAVALLAALALGYRIVHSRRRRGRDPGDGAAK